MRTSKSIPQQLGAKIARDIFAKGEAKHEHITRVSLVTGRWPDDERDVCGFRESALAELISESIARHMGKR